MRLFDKASLFGLCAALALVGFTGCSNEETVIDTDESAVTDDLGDPADFGSEDGDWESGSTIDDFGTDEAGSTLDTADDVDSLESGSTIDDSEL